MSYYFYSIHYCLDFNFRINFWFFFPFYSIFSTITECCFSVTNKASFAIRELEGLFRCCPNFRTSMCLAGLWNHTKLGCGKRKVYRTLLSILISIIVLRILGCLNSQYNSSWKQNFYKLISNKIQTENIILKNSPSHNQKLLTMIFNIHINCLLLC